MKRYVPLLICLLLLLCLLTACGCRHQWVEADCLSAKHCANCGAAEGDALGHDFTPATCTAPETCTRCAETRGEPLPHSYGQWTVEEPYLIRFCADCGSSESTDLNQYAQQLVVGHWRSTSGQFHDGSTAPIDTYSMTFNPDGSLLAQLTEECTGSWTFLKAFQENDSLFLFYLLNLEIYPEPVIAYITETGELCFVGETSFFMSITFVSDAAFLQEQQEGNAELIGIWYSTNSIRSNDSSTKPALGYTIAFHEDGTFTADIGQHYTGTWKYTNRLIPDSADPSRNIYYFFLNFDGNPEPTDAIISYTGLRIYGSDVQIDFTPEEYPDIPKIIGTWESASNHPDESGYTLTVNADGTFTASLDKETAGTWYFFDYTDEDGYRYAFHFQGEENGRLFSLVSETALQIWAAYDGDTPIYIPMRKP